MYPICNFLCKKLVEAFPSAFIISIGFTIKENQYIVLFIFALFFLFISWRQIVDWILSRKRLSEFTREGDVLILLSLLTLPLSAPLISIFQEPLGITLAASSTNPNVPTGSPEGIGYYIATIFSVSLLFLSLFLGWLWKRFEFIEGDISDFNTCLQVTRNVDYVLHQAAIGSVPRSIEDSAAISPVLSPILVVFPCPRLPYPLYPQHLTLPSFNRAHA